MLALEITLWLVGTYLLLGFLTALFLSQTPFREVGLFFNTLFAAFYWVDAIRGRL